ncbi:MAG: response regulator receiver modulated diguanylate cyclase [Xanthobacteraceae bacterium]|nr:response regulator receiver modulated diguanylate cyclase [Xanthobacteraceae bacterium]
MRILVVDDSEDGRDLMEAMLVSAGYEDVFSVESAAEAFRYLGVGGAAVQEPSPVDLILLDILMPGIDGIEACARIHKEKRHADVPVIMVTALADVDSLGSAFVAGATDYITKPVNRIELLARVRSALKLKSELDRRRARENELLNFMSTWGDRRASNLIDGTTGLFVGEVAEAYLMAATNFRPGIDTSVIALAIDRLDAYRSTQGDTVTNEIMTQVAHAVRATAATIGVVAAAYRNGMIVLVIPDLRSEPALQLGEALRASVSNLGINNSESIAANHVTASVAVVSGHVDKPIDSVQLLTRALSAVPRIAAAGGNRVLAEVA